MGHDETAEEGAEGRADLCAGVDEGIGEAALFLGVVRREEPRGRGIGDAFPDAEKEAQGEEDPEA